MDQTVTTVAGVRPVGPDAVAVDVTTPPSFDAEPGQFVKVVAELDGEDQSRFYTISSPRIGDTFEVTVEVDPEGTLGPWLAERAPGDELRVAGPFGRTYYDGEPRAVVLAGGPGVGPAVGIAERALEEGNVAGVVYRDDDPIHGDRLDALVEAGAFVAVVGDDEPLAPAVADALDAVGADAQLFVYGFADFLDVATDAIADAGADPDGAQFENFG
jgi:3-phenylpropionate/trans-cinnamate dioxygenase ferredoxin reductase subunit